MNKGRETCHIFANKIKRRYLRGLKTANTLGNQNERKWKKRKESNNVKKTEFNIFNI